MTRSWQSKAGESLLMSLIVRPERTPPTEATVLVLVTALAVCDCCRFFGAEALIKWPNDIVCHGKKLCGMLLEMSLDGDMVGFAVAGVGLNVSGYPYDDTLRHAGCLSEACGHTVSRKEALHVFLLAFEKYYALWQSEGAEAVRTAYRAQCVTLGKPVQVIGADETFTGTAVGLTEDNSLLVAKENGETVPVHAGDVSVRGIMGYV